MLSCSPNTRFNSLPLNQLTAYVFCATAKDSPPILKKKEGTKENTLLATCKATKQQTAAANTKMTVFQKFIYVQVDLMHICK